MSLRDMRDIAVPGASAHLVGAARGSRRGTTSASIDGSGSNGLTHSAYDDGGSDTHRHIYATGVDVEASTTSSLASAPGTASSSSPYAHAQGCLRAGSGHAAHGPAASAPPSTPKQQQRHHHRVPRGGAKGDGGDSDTSSDAPAPSPIPAYVRAKDLEGYRSPSSVGSGARSTNGSRRRDGPQRSVGFHDEDDIIGAGGGARSQRSDGRGGWRPPYDGEAESAHSSAHSHGYHHGHRTYDNHSHPAPPNSYTSYTSVSNPHSPVSEASADGARVFSERSASGSRLRRSSPPASLSHASPRTPVVLAGELVATGTATTTAAAAATSLRARSRSEQTLHRPPARARGGSDLDDAESQRRVSATSSAGTAWGFIDDGIAIVRRPPYTSTAAGEHGADDPHPRTSSVRSRTAPAQPQHLQNYHAHHRSNQPRVPYVPIVHDDPVPAERSSSAGAVRTASLSAQTPARAACSLTHVPPRDADGERDRDWDIRRASASAALPERAPMHTPAYYGAHARSPTGGGALPPRSMPVRRPLVTTSQTQLPMSNPSWGPTAATTAADSAHAHLPADASGTPVHRAARTVSTDSGCGYEVGVGGARRGPQPCAQPPQPWAPPQAAATRQRSTSLSAGPVVRGGLEAVPRGFPHMHGEDVHRHNHHVPADTASAPPAHSARLRSLSAKLPTRDVEWMPRTRAALENSAPAPSPSHSPVSSGYERHHHHHHHHHSDHEPYTRSNSGLSASLFSGDVGGGSAVGPSRCMHCGGHNSVASVASNDTRDRDTELLLRSPQAEAVVAAAVPAPATAYASQRAPTPFNPPSSTPSEARSQGASLPRIQTHNHHGPTLQNRSPKHAVRGGRALPQQQQQQQDPTPQHPSPSLVVYDDNGGRQEFVLDEESYALASSCRGAAAAAGGVGENAVPAGEIQAQGRPTAQVLHGRVRGASLGSNAMVTLQVQFCPPPPSASGASSDAGGLSTGAGVGGGHANRSTRGWSAGHAPPRLNQTTLTAHSLSHSAGFNAPHGALVGGRGVSAMSDHNTVTSAGTAPAVANTAPAPTTARAGGKSGKAKAKGGGSGAAGTTGSMLRSTSSGSKKPTAGGAKTVRRASVDRGAGLATTTPRRAATHAKASSRKSSPGGMSTASSASRVRKNSAQSAGGTFAASPGSTTAAAAAAAATPRRKATSASAAGGAASPAASMAGISASAMCGPRGGVARRGSFSGRPAAAVRTSSPGAHAGVVPTRTLVTPGTSRAGSTAGGDPSASPSASTTTTRKVKTRGHAAAARAAGSASPAGRAAAVDLHHHNPRGGSGTHAGVALATAAGSPPRTPPPPPAYAVSTTPVAPGGASARSGTPFAKKDAALISSPPPRKVKRKTSAGSGGGVVRKRSASAGLSGPASPTIVDTARSPQRGGASRTVVERSGGAATAVAAPVSTPAASTRESAGTGSPLVSPPAYAGYDSDSSVSTESSVSTASSHMTTATTSSDDSELRLVTYRNTQQAVEISERNRSLMDMRYRLRSPQPPTHRGCTPRRVAFEPNSETMVVKYPAVKITYQ